MEGRGGEAWGREVMGREGNAVYKKGGETAGGKREHDGMEERSIYMYTQWNGA